MTDEEQSTSGLVPGMVQQFIAQLRTTTGRLEDLAGFGGHHPGSLPLPGALSAAQLRSIADSIAAQRRSIEALRVQLTAFDGQLAAMEQILGPLAEWSRTWADLEERLLNIGRKPPAGGSLPVNFRREPLRPGHRAGPGPVPAHVRSSRGAATGGRPRS